MCGRYKLSVPFRELVRLYNLTSRDGARFDNMPARYNIAPTQDVPVVRLNADTKERELVMMRWGLVLSRLMAALAGASNARRNPDEPRKHNPAGRGLDLWSPGSLGNAAAPALIVVGLMLPLVALYCRRAAAPATDGDLSVRFIGPARPFAEQPLRELREIGKVC